MTTAAAMIVLIDEAIAGLIDPARGAAIKRSGSAAGVMMETHDLESLKNLRREYAQLAVEASGETGALSITRVTNAEPS